MTDRRPAWLPQLVIFDCDGVLVDSERIAVRVSATGLTALGWPMTEADVLDRFVGRSDEFIRGEVAGRLGADVADGWQIEFQRRYREAFATELKAVDGVVEALDAITIPTCVASSGTHEKIRYSLGLVGLLDRFVGRIFGGSDVTRPKPAPDLFLHAAAHLGVAPADCAVIEDSPAGIEAARAAGMRAFGYAGGLTPADRLAGADTVVFDDMRELPRLLRRDGRLVHGRRGDPAGARSFLKDRR
jgi:HAD superfamily hydrolase (TIGR01509 family)